MSAQQKRRRLEHQKNTFGSPQTNGQCIPNKMYSPDQQKIGIQNYFSTQYAQQIKPGTCANQNDLDRKSPSVVQDSPAISGPAAINSTAIRLSKTNKISGFSQNSQKRKNQSEILKEQTKQQSQKSLQQKGTLINQKNSRDKNLPHKQIFKTNYNTTICQNLPSEVSNTGAGCSNFKGPSNNLTLKPPISKQKQLQISSLATTSSTKDIALKQNLSTKYASQVDSRTSHHQLISSDHKTQSIASLLGQTDLIQSSKRAEELDSKGIQKQACEGLTAQKHTHYFNDNIQASQQNQPSQASLASSSQLDKKVPELHIPLILPPQMTRSTNQIGSSGRVSTSQNGFHRQTFSLGNIKVISDSRDPLSQLQIHKLTEQSKNQQRANFGDENITDSQDPTPSTTSTTNIPTLRRFKRSSHNPNQKSTGYLLTGQLGNNPMTPSSASENKQRLLSIPKQNIKTETNRQIPLIQQPLKLSKAKSRANLEISTPLEDVFGPKKVQLNPIKNLQSQQENVEKSDLNAPEDEAHLLSPKTRKLENQSKQKSVTLLRDLISKNQTLETGQSYKNTQTLLVPKKQNSQLSERPKGFLKEHLKSLQHYQTESQTNEKKKSVTMLSPKQKINQSEALIGLKSSKNFKRLNTNYSRQDITSEFSSLTKINNKSTALQRVSNASVKNATSKKDINRPAKTMISRKNINFSSQILTKSIEREIDDELKKIDISSNKSPLKPGIKNEYQTNLYYQGKKLDQNLAEKLQLSDPKTQKQKKYRENSSSKTKKTKKQLFTGPQKELPEASQKFKLQIEIPLSPHNKIQQKTSKNVTSQQKDTQIDIKTDKEPNQNCSNFQTLEEATSHPQQRERSSPPVDQSSQKFEGPTDRTVSRSSSQNLIIAGIRAVENTVQSCLPASHLLTSLNNKQIYQTQKASESTTKQETTTPLIPKSSTTDPIPADPPSYHSSQNNPQTSSTTNQLQINTTTSQKCLKPPRAVKQQIVVQTTQNQLRHPATTTNRKNATYQLLTRDLSQGSTRSTRSRDKSVGSPLAEFANVSFQPASKIVLPGHLGYESAKTSVKRMGLVRGYAANTHQGLLRNYNEDRVSIILNISEPQSRKNHQQLGKSLKQEESKQEWPTCSFFGVYDGHGGHGCADFLRDNLHNFIIQEPCFVSQPREAIKKGFQKAENIWINSYGIQRVKSGEKRSTDEENNQINTETVVKVKDRSGSCAIILLVVQDTCYVANVGDSRAVMSSNGGKRTFALSRDHKPSDEHEQERIFEGGGQIYSRKIPLSTKNSSLKSPNSQTNLQSKDLNSPSMAVTTQSRGEGESPQQSAAQGPLRIFPGRLSVSRSFGDVEAKVVELGGNPQVLIATPEIKAFKIQKEHDFILLGCDGIFDRLSNKESVQVVWNGAKDLPIFNPNVKTVHQLCGVGVDYVLKNSLLRRTLDNVTSVLVSFKNFKQTVFGDDLVMPDHNQRQRQPMTTRNNSTKNHPSSLELTSRNDKQGGPVAFGPSAPTTTSTTTKNAKSSSLQSNIVKSDSELVQVMPKQRTSSEQRFIEDMAKQNLVLDKKAECFTSESNQVLLNKTRIISQKEQNDGQSVEKVQKRVAGMRPPSGKPKYFKFDEEQDDKICEVKI